VDIDGAVPDAETDAVEPLRFIERTHQRGKPFPLGVVVREPAERRHTYTPTCIRPDALDINGKPTGQAAELSPDSEVVA
jgi:hypothetical protein